MDPMVEIRATFFVECEELLEALEAGLLAMSEGDQDMETVNAVFRAVHSIKGGAGAFALEDLVRFAHCFETTLDEVRSERLEPSLEVMKVLLRSADQLADLVRMARDEETADPGPTDDLIHELQQLIGVPAETTAEPAAEEVDFQPLTLAIDLGEDLAAAPDPVANRFAIRFRPKAELYVHGNETTLLLRGLAELGEIQVLCHTEALPLLDELDPEGSYLEWTITVTTEKDESEIHEVFEFVDGDCDLKIRLMGEDELVLEAAPATAPFEPASADETLTENAAETAATDIAEVVELRPDAAAETASQPAESANPPAHAKPGREVAKSEVAAPRATVRVDLERVDRLINLVGELVINQAMLAQCVEEAGIAPSSGVATGLDEFKQLTREIQEGVMAIRAQPVKSLFQRMSRIVREGADATGKSVRLVTEGEATEVDKTVVERLSDPLTHMIRNAVDHGLEGPEKRLAAGKPAEGIVRLSAAHRSGRVAIEIADDGAGINRKRVKAIAIEKGLIPPDAPLSDGEIDNLLFMPGFSTAKEVSDLSGRGVGMDVVKRAIHALGGRISITSEAGRGTTFSVSLPLTLAVLDGMVVRVADQTVVVPLSAIVETLKPETHDIHSVGDGTNVVFIRDRFVPIVDAGHNLGFRPYVRDFAECVFLLIEMSDGTRSALVVDAIQDQRQVVIKGLEDNYGHITGVAAATILGDGRIALILDPDTLVGQSAAGPHHCANVLELAG